MAPKNKKKNSSQPRLVQGAVASASFEEQERDPTTVAPDGSQIPVAHALPVQGVEASEGGGSFFMDQSRMNRGLLLETIDDHEDDRNRLALAFHNATLRVKGTYEALKMSLEPLTFAYGEDDGHSFYEKIVNSPQAYAEDRRPAFAQVAVAAMEHDQAMHSAGVSQRELEEFDSRTIPVDLLRQVINQRFARLEERVRHLERFGLTKQPQSQKAQLSNLSTSPLSPLKSLSTTSQLLDVGDSGGGSGGGGGGAISPPVSPPTGLQSPTPNSPVSSDSHAVATENQHMKATFSRELDLACSPTLVQHWVVESKVYPVKSSPGSPASPLVSSSSLNENNYRNVVCISPFFPEVSLDEDDEFNEIHQRRADAIVAFEFARFMHQHHQHQQHCGSSKSQGSGNDVITDIDSGKGDDDENSFNSSKVQTNMLFWTQTDSFSCLEDLIPNTLQLIISQPLVPSSSSKFDEHATNSLASSSQKSMPKIKLNKKFQIILVGDIISTENTTVVAHNSHRFNETPFWSLLENLSNQDFFLRFNDCSKHQSIKTTSITEKLTELKGKDVLIYQLKP